MEKNIIYSLKKMTEGNFSSHECFMVYVFSFWISNLEALQSLDLWSFPPFLKQYTDLLMVTSWSFCLLHVNSKAQ